MQHATCNMQHAACNMQHASCRWSIGARRRVGLRADSRRSLCPMPMLQHATCNMQHATCNMQQATCIDSKRPLCSDSIPMLDRNSTIVSVVPLAAPEIGATCTMHHAPCKMPCATGVIGEPQKAPS